MNQNMLKRIESFGDRFKEEYRSDWNKDKLLSDWKDSLKFFFEHSFMRGRKDELSIRFLEITTKILEKTLFNDINYNLEDLQEQLIKEGVNNKRDRIMIIETINFIKQIPDNNLTKYFIEKLKEDSNEAYNELIKIDYVGNKIATLYLRELCWMFDIKPTDYVLIFPIDTWVRQIINRLNILDIPEEKLSDSEIQKRTINFCLKNNINPMKFNAGIWYIGKNSLNIVLEEISK